MSHEPFRIQPAIVHVDPQPMRPFSFAEGKEALEQILARVNVTGNDIRNMNLWVLEGRGDPGSGPISSAIGLDLDETRALIAELELLPDGLRDVILTRNLPERLKPATKDGVFLKEAAAAQLNAFAESVGLGVRFEAREPVLPLASIHSAQPASRPATSAIEGIAAIGAISASAPVDAKLVGRLNEISSVALSKLAGKGNNVLSSVSNIVDMIAPVSVSLLPSPTDDGAMKAIKANTFAMMKEDLHAEHLSDGEFVHQLQVIHAHLLRYKGMITLGNEIAIDSGRHIRSEVQDAAEKGFDAAITSRPMQSNPEQAAEDMSTAIEKATTVWAPAENGAEPKKVKDGLSGVVKPDSVSGLDAASIATFTALLDWQVVFDKGKTVDAEVTSANGSTDTKKMMEFQTGYRRNPTTGDMEEIPKLLAAEENGFLFVRLPYHDKTKEPSSGPRRGFPPTSIYRIVGAPLPDAANRHTKLARMLERLPANEPAGLDYESRAGTVKLARIQTEGEADPFELLGSADVRARAWQFPLLEEGVVTFTKGIHKGAAEDTEEGTIVQFVTFGGMEMTSIIQPTPPFELRTDVPYYNNITIELKGARGEPIPLKVAEWTVENFAEAKEPTSKR